MELYSTRGDNHNACCIGDLFVEDKFECYTLEDLVREIEGQPVSSWKIQNQTAIPRGRYKLVPHDSPHFGCIVPMLVDVPGFDYVLIHWGNTSVDTDGCILVGQQRSDDDIRNSRDAFKSLFPKIQDAWSNSEEVWITVK